jgi:4-carboxymuconolactone decarboxylase
MARSPSVNYAVQALSNAARVTNNKANVPLYLDELAIIMVAKFWGHQMMWAGHLANGIKAGISEAAVNSAAQNKKLPGMRPDEAAVFDFAQEVLYNHAVSDATYKAVLDVLGEVNLVNLMGTMSVYQFSCMVGNVAGGKPALRPGAEAPFPQARAK